MSERIDSAVAELTDATEFARTAKLRSVELDALPAKTEAERQEHETLLLSLPLLSAAVEAKHKGLASARALDVHEAITAVTKGGIPDPVERDGLTLIFDAPPEVYYDEAGNERGVDAWVRAFRAGREVRIDPHRRIGNAPTQVVDGDTVRSDPHAAWIDALFHSVRVAPNPAGWRTRGTVETNYCTTASGGMQSSDDPSYSAARGGTGSGLTVDTDTTSILGQLLVGGSDYRCREYFFAVANTVPGGSTVSSVVLSIYISADNSATDFTANLRANNWGSTLTTADWLVGSGGTLLATLATAGVSAGAFNGFSSHTSLTLGGTDYWSAQSSRQEGNNAPTGNEYLSIRSPHFAGTSSDPYITVTYTAGATSTIGSTFPRMAAAIAVKDHYPSTVNSSFPKMSAVLSTSIANFTTPIAASFPRMTAALTVTQKHPSTIAAAFPKMTAALTAVMQPSGTISSAFPRMAAALAVAQKYPVTIAASFPRMTAALVARMNPSGVIAASFPRMTAAVSVLQHPRGAIASSFPRMTAVMAGIVVNVSGLPRPRQGVAFLSARLQGVARYFKPRQGGGY